MKGILNSAETWNGLLEAMDSSSFILLIFMMLKIAAVLKFIVKAKAQKLLFIHVYLKTAQLMKTFKLVDVFIF